MEETKFHGFFRGLVINNDDRATATPYRGKIQISVPQVYGTQIPNEDLPWAEPCFPVFGGGRNIISKTQRESSGIIGLPPIGASIWVCFEQGDPQSPVWVGTWFGGKDVVKGSTDNSYEMGAECFRDSSGQAEYPEIFCLKPPYGPEYTPGGGKPSGMWIRFLGGNRIEIVYNQGQNYFSIDGQNKKIQVKATGFDIELTASAQDDQKGNITLSGETVTISAKNFIVSAEDIIRMVSSGTGQYTAKEANLFSSSEVIVGNAPSARGFEDH